MGVVAFLEIRGAWDAEIRMAKARKEQLLVALEFLEDGEDAGSQHPALQEKYGFEELVEFGGVVRVGFACLDVNERGKNDRERRRDPVLVFQISDAIHDLDSPQLIFGTRSVAEAVAHLFQFLLQALDDPLHRADFEFAGDFL